MVRSHHQLFEARKRNKNIFLSSTANHEEENKFRCTIYYLSLSGFKHYKNISSQIKLLLSKSNVPQHYVLDIKYPPSSNSAILYFTTAYKRNETKRKINYYLNNHIVNSINVY